MQVNAVSSVNGRIQRVAIFDTNNYLLENKHNPFLPVLNDYRELADGLNSFRETSDKIELIIFFAINRTGQLPPPYYDANANIHFVPVNYQNEKVGIGENWIQDMVQIIKPNLVYLSKSITKELWDQMTPHFGNCALDHFEMECPGGNILRAKDSAGDYIVMGTRLNTECDQKYLSKLSGIDTDRIYRAYDQELSMWPRLFFHADLFCTLGGTLPSGEELLLIGDIYDQSNPKLTAALNRVAANFEAFKTDKTKPPFHVIRLPFILVADEKGQVQRALSYNNCLVENFIVGENLRQINFYFPDYSTEVARIVNTAASSATQAKEFVLNIAGQSLSFIDSMTSSNGLRFVLESKEWKKPPTAIGGKQEASLPEIVRQVQDNIKKLMFGITVQPGVKINVQFVRHKFMDHSSRIGSLHCLTKVLERDQI